MTELSCPAARSLVSDYIDGDLDADLARSLEQHLETCPNCPPLYASLVETLAELKTLDDVGGVDHLVQRVLAGPRRAAGARGSGATRGMNVGGCTEQRVPRHPPGRRRHRHPVGPHRMERDHHLAAQPPDQHHNRHQGAA